MDISWVKGSHWLIIEPLDYKQREILYITAQAAGIIVLDRIRYYTSDKERIGYNYVQVRLTHQIEPAESDLQVFYTDVLEAMREIIRRETNATKKLDNNNAA